MHRIKKALKVSSLAALLGTVLLLSRSRGKPISNERRSEGLRQANHEYSVARTEPKDKKPKWVLTLERYRVLIELLASIAAIVALFALVLSYQSVISSNRSADSSRSAAEAARRAVQLQEAQLQPIFLAQVDYHRGKRKQLSQELRVISPNGTFLDARADVASLLVLEEEPGERALVPLSDPYYWLPTDEQRDPKGRGVQIASWKSDSPWLGQLKCIWQEQLGQYGDLAYIVSWVKVKYRDVVRAEHELYFRIGGRSSEYSRFMEEQTAEIKRSGESSFSCVAYAGSNELEGTLLGRAETVNSNDAAMCMEAAHRSLNSVDLMDPTVVPAKETLRSIFEAYKDYRSPAFEEKCAGA